MQANYTSQNANYVHEPSSYWQETVTHLRLSDDLPSVIDVANIGGGVMGAPGYNCAREMLKIR